MIKYEYLALLIGGLSFVLSLLVLMLILRLRKLVSDNIENNRKEKLVFKSFFHEQLILAKEQMVVFFRILDIFKDVSIFNQDNIVTKFQKLKNDAIENLRKMEVVSLSAETQRKALMFFAGSKMGRKESVIKYIRKLQKKGVIFKNNVSLALRITEKLL